MENYIGCIYILTNPSFPEYVKIGYADNVEKRLKELNRSECIPFAFRLYAYYKVTQRLTDIKLHSMIDKLNPNLRAIEDFNGKKRVREFYALKADEAYDILEAIAQIHGTEENLVLVEKTEEDKMQENMAKVIKEYSEELFTENYPHVKELYESLKNKILELDGVTIEPKKFYIAFKRKTNICDVILRKNRLVIFINVSKGMLNDPKNRCEDVTTKGHWGNGDYAFNVYSSDDVEYAMNLISQSYKIN